MNVQTLYENVNSELYTLMKMKKGEAMQEKASAIYTLISDNKALLQKSTQGHVLVYSLTTLLSFLASIIFLSNLLPNDLGIALMGALAFSLMAFLLSLVLVSTFRNKVDSSILLAHQLSEKGWRFTTLNTQATWERWREKYPFLNYGDMDDALALRIYGEYDKYDFSYFEYDYTLEYEEEVEHEDKDGNTYYETEYSYESFTESGIIVDIEHSLPSIQTLAGTAQGDAMKFSYIDLNKKMSAYTSNTHQATVFFSPKTQQLFAKFYTYFPAANVSIQDGLIFINFREDLLNMSRNRNFDESLVGAFKSKAITKYLDSLMFNLLPLLQSMQSESTSS